MRYYYPDDVVKVDGATIAGYTKRISPNGGMAFQSLLEVEFTAQELARLDDLYFRIWENARDRKRAQNAMEWLERVHPKIAQERRDWDAYVVAVGMEKVSTQGFKAWRGSE